MRTIGAWPLFSASAACWIGRSFFVEGVDGGLFMSALMFGLLGIIRHIEVHHQRDVYWRKISHD